MGPSRLTKQADSLEDQQQAALRAESLRQAAGLGLAALGAGAASRSALGLLGLIRRNLSDRPKLRSAPTLLSIPIPVRRLLQRPVEEETEEDQEPLTKAALLPDAKTVEELQGHYLSKWLAGAGGLAGGWYLTDWLLGRRRKAELEGELQNAEDEFHDALAGQYDRPLKAAADGSEPLGQSLDRLYDGLTKLAGIGAWLDDIKQGLGSMANQGLAGYTGVAGILALLTGVAAYDFAQRRGSQAMLQKAIKHRQREESVRRPSELFAAPVAIPVEEDEETSRPGLANALS